MEHEIIKWWKDKTFLIILGIALLTMVCTFLTAYFLNNYWQLLAIPVACLGGFIIRKFIVHKLDN